MRRAAITALVAVACLRAPCVHAQQVVHPWQGLGDGIVGSYTWPTVTWHAAAVVTTPALVLIADRPVQQVFQQDNPFGQTFARVTLGIGWVTPVVIPLGMYVGGLATDVPKLATAGAAALQAAAVQAVIVTALKWLTDRAGPFPDGDPARGRWSRGLLHDSNDPKAFNFNPFDIAGGLRWPSGHTASNVALAAALAGFYADEPWVAIVGYPLALAIGIGMIEGDYHWLSDIVAGALMGQAIGWTIGRQFRARYEEALQGKAASSDLQLAPLLSQQTLGLCAFGRF